MVMYAIKAKYITPDNRYNKIFLRQNTASFTQ